MYELQGNSTATTIEHTRNLNVSMAILRKMMIGTLSETTSKNWLPLVPRVDGKVRPSKFKIIKREIADGSIRIMRKGVEA